MKIEIYKCDCCGNTIDTNRVHVGGLDLCEACNTLRLKMLQRMVADDLPNQAIHVKSQSHP